MLEKCQQINMLKPSFTILTWILCIEVSLMLAFTIGICFMQKLICHVMIFNKKGSGSPRCDVRIMIYDVYDIFH